MGAGVLVRMLVRMSGDHEPSLALALAIAIALALALALAASRRGGNRHCRWVLSPQDLGLGLGLGFRLRVWN